MQVNYSKKEMEMNLRRTVTWFIAGHKLRAFENLPHRLYFQKGEKRKGGIFDQEEIGRISNVGYGSAGSSDFGVRAPTSDQLRFRFVLC